jgi:hypothetical protein
MRAAEAAAAMARKTDIFSPSAALVSRGYGHPDSRPVAERA